MAGIWHAGDPEFPDRLGIPIRPASLAADGEQVADGSFAIVVGA